MSRPLAAYIRVSSEKQARSGLGLEAQRDSITRATGEDLVWFEDAAVSGALASSERPALSAALDAVASGECSGVVVAKLDRLGRSALDVLTIADQAKREGWRLVIADLGLDTRTPTGQLMLTLLAGVAELEREMIRERTRAACDAKRQRGERMGRLPAAAHDPERAEQAAKAEAVLTQGGTIAGAVRASGMPETTVRRIKKALSKRAGAQNG